MGKPSPTRLITAIFTAVVVGACSSGGWSAEERATMLESCEGGLGGVETEGGAGFCGCVVDYLALRFSLEEVDADSIGAAAEACR